MSIHFYFHTEGDRTELDPDGVELTDLAHAQKETLGLLGRMLRDAAGDRLWQGKDWEIWVTDAPNGEGHVFFRLQLSASKPGREFS
jgi:hypothetical protein